MFALAVSAQEFFQILPWGLFLGSMAFIYANYEGRKEARKEQTHD